MSGSGYDAVVDVDDEVRYETPAVMMLSSDFPSVKDFVE